MKTLHPVCLALLLTASAAQAQDAADWRARYAAGEAARAEGDVATYATEMAAAASTMPEGHLNRPFVQYHAARGAALDGREAEAAAWLETAWDEDIEALMISFAAFDPAFDSIEDGEAFRRVMGRADDLELGVTLLGGSVYLLTGAGSNVVVQVGSEGALVVDTGYRPALSALRTALRGLGARSIARVVITHAHEDHMGSVRDLGPDAVVLTHPGTADAMAEPYAFMEGVVLPPKPEGARPDVLVARDTVIRSNGEDVSLVPTAAHTAGDLSVYFPEARVAHLGDSYLPGEAMMFPGANDPDGFLDRMEAFLDSMHPETVIVVGHGPPVDIAAVSLQVETSRACIAFVRRALEDGLSAEEAVERAGDRFPAGWIGYFHRLFSAADAR